jgi:hypothetical protein
MSLMDLCLPGFRIGDLTGILESAELVRCLLRGWDSSSLESVVIEYRVLKQYGLEY